MKNLNVISETEESIKTNSFYNQTGVSHKSDIEDLNIDSVKLRAIVEKQRDDTLDFDDEYESADDIVNEEIYNNCNLFKSEEDVVLRDYVKNLDITNSRSSTIFNGNRKQNNDR